MAAIANITLTDGAATPVNHVFTPESSAPIAKWIERTGVDIGNPWVSMTKRREGAVNRIELQLLVPVLEAVSGTNPAGFTPAPQVAYTCKAVLTLFQPVRCTKQNRKDLRVMLIDLLGEAVTVSMNDDLESPY